MAVHVYAAIYIGSYDVSLKIFEISEKKKLKEIDLVRSRLELGANSFSSGKIGYELVDKLCDTLLEFKQIMNSYRVDFYEVFASAFLKNTQNELYLLNQIYLRTGLTVKVMSNSEHRFISYEAVSGKENFEQMIQTSAAVVDVGGSSIQITLFEKGKLVTTQQIKVGAVRMRSLLEGSGHSLNNYAKQIEEYLNKKLEVFRSMYLPGEIDTFILISEFGPALVKKVEKNGQDDRLVSSEKFMKLIQKLQKKTLEEIAVELNLLNDSEPLIVPSIVLYKSLVQNMNPRDVWVPGTTILDGMAYDYAYRKKLLKNTHDFEADVISAALNMSERFNSYSPHIDALRSLSVKIYDALKKVHGMGNRQRLLLEVATILHDCGKYVSLTEDATCTYQIIMSSEIIGLTHLERQIVAFIVLYNTLPLESYESVKEDMDKETYLIVSKLSAILRVANALDQSHKQKFKNMRITVKNREFIMAVEAFEDMALEQLLFDTKTSYFENVFSMKPVLKLKRIYQLKSETKKD